MVIQVDEMILPEFFSLFLLTFLFLYFFMYMYALYGLRRQLLLHRRLFEARNALHMCSFSLHYAAVRHDSVSSTEGQPLSSTLVLGIAYHERCNRWLVFQAAPSEKPLIDLHRTYVSLLC